ncbi:hypothetical protein B9Z55_000319 [Caenorhabditis nigoni]|uniref:SUN domain-containing protein n=1 Tax=Caenorhabditis nigoni TaxID=1611254 RepID=A0A2G5VP25_9PELO|nr:hypothetical protein B9Z55_000319 [Caenorhabditis nigoni]
MVLPTYRTNEKPNNGSDSSSPNPVPPAKGELNSKKQMWYHWFNISFRQYMILEFFLIITLIMVLCQLQTISCQNNQVIEMVSSMKSQISNLERKLISRKPGENSKPLEQPISDVLKNMKKEQPIKNSKPSKTEKLLTPPSPLNLSNNIPNIPKKGYILNAADYLKGASVDNAHSSRSNLKPLNGHDQSYIVLLQRPPTYKSWCSNEHNPVLTINLAQFIKPISVSYQHSNWTHIIPKGLPMTYDVVACLDSTCKSWVPLVSNCEYSSQSIGTERFCDISPRLNVPSIHKVQFRFKENYGDSQMTCVHLVRVYGEPHTPVRIETKKSMKSGVTYIDHLKGASGDNAHSSSSNLNPIIGYDQINKVWCTNSNEHNPVLTIDLAKTIRPVSVSYQHSKFTQIVPMSTTPRTFDVVACFDLYCQDWKPLVSNCEYSNQSIGTEQFCNIPSHLNAPLIWKVQFRFHENHGAAQKTCIHLLRVYGETGTPVPIEEKKIVPNVVKSA